MRASEAVLQSWKEPELVFGAQLQFVGPEMRFVGSEINKHVETCERVKLDFDQHVLPPRRDLDSTEEQWAFCVCVSVSPLKK